MRRHPVSVTAPALSGRSCVLFLLGLFGLLVVATGLHAAAPRLSVLIVDGQNNHDWKSTSPAMAEILEATGRFRVTTATSPARGADLSGFRPSFADHDVVLLNYNGQPWPEETREAFVDFVRGGGGVVVIHAADNSFPKWKEFNEIIALGGWGGRNEKDGPYIRYRDGKLVRDESPGRGGSHGRQFEAVIETRQPLHPITFGLPERWKHARDEIYDRLRGPARNLTVLATTLARKDMGGSGEHEPALMTIDYGAGRIFHSILGHDARPMRSSPGFRATLTRGTEWAACGAVTLEPPADLRPEGDGGVAGAGWVALFDGLTLDGWSQRNGTAKYRAEKGTVVGVTNEGSPNSFLCTTRDYGDFELVFEVKVDDALNSGVQIRSRSNPDDRKGRVHGPQVEIATNGTAGFVYGEALGTGWLSKDRSGAEARAAFRRGEWNHYRVLAKGPSIRTWVNGVPVAKLEDETTGMASGFIGLQVHGIGRGTGPYEVRWRHIYLRPVADRS